jgi:predicted DNA-binding protein (MmcQ/YjbR family)
MDLPDAIEHCLAKNGCEETTPFGPEVLVYKVAGKMFALSNPSDVPARLNLKCDPERAVELREEHEAVIPGYHMNKKHWNTVILDGSLPPRLVAELIDHSYELVVASLPKSKRPGLGRLAEATASSDHSRPAPRTRSSCGLEFQPDTPHSPTNRRRPGGMPLPAPTGYPLHT